MSDTGYLQLPDFQYWFDALTQDDFELVRKTLSTYSSRHDNQDIRLKQESHHDHQDSHHRNHDRHFGNQDCNPDNQEHRLKQELSNHDNQNIILTQDSHHGKQYNHHDNHDSHPYDQVSHHDNQYNRHDNHGRHNGSKDSLHDNQEMDHKQDSHHDNQAILKEDSHHDNQAIILKLDSHHGNHDSHHSNQENSFKQEFLNGQFCFPPLTKIPNKITEGLYRKLSYPLTLAAVHGAARVVDVLFDFGVAVHVHEVEGNNLLHCLVEAASLDADHEQDMIKIYKQLRRRLSTLDLEILLKEENEGGHAMRPLEYAAYKGTLQLMFALWETPGVYVIREEIVDVSVYQWYDVTEYVTLIGGRYSLSPIILIAELTELQLTTQFARDMFEKGSFVADWIGKKTDLIILKFFFALRIVYVSMFSAYDMDESWLRQIGGISSDTGLTPLNMTNNSFIYCSRTGALNFSKNLRNFMLVFLIINSIAVIAYDVFSIVGRVRGNCQRYRRFLKSEYSGAKARYINLTFSLTVFAQIILLNVVTERGWGTIIMDMVRLETTISSLLTSQYFLRTIPGIGHIFTYMWKASSDLFVFGWFIIDVVVAFSRLEMLYVNTNSLGGCVSQFSNFFISLYTQFLSFLNMQDYTQFNLRSRTLLFVEHITFVFVAGVMLFNLLLAISNDTVNRVYRDREMMTSIGRLFVTMEINITISRMPFIGGLYGRYFHAWRVRNTFVCEDGRMCLVRVRKNRRQRVVCEE